MAFALLALGSNLGDRRATLEQAVERLAVHAQIRVLARSAWHETAAVGGPADQPPFLNGAVTIETSLSPAALLATVEQIEQQLERTRHARWGPRTIDLDLLLYDQLVSQSPQLTLPHPRMSFRRFVLGPACEIAADWQHPTIGWTLGELLAHLDQAPPYIAMASTSGSYVRQLVETLATGLPVQVILDPARPDASGDSADPSGRAWQRQIELLDRRAAALEAVPWRQVGWIVSDYWLGQMPAEASVCFDRDSAAAFEQLWQARTEHLVRPKLLVWLDDGPLTAVGQPANEITSGGDMTLAHDLREALARRVQTPGQGPVLRIKGAQPSTAGEEIVAAVRAMQ
jgi:2-amino-4-hydroxy-6-hydroxymethyldihydropteridine diphosphokinase